MGTLIPRQNKKCKVYVLFFPFALVTAFFTVPSFVQAGSVSNTISINATTGGNTSVGTGTADDHNDTGRAEGSIFVQTSINGKIIYEHAEKKIGTTTTITIQETIHTVTDAQNEARRTEEEHERPKEKSRETISPTPTLLLDTQATAGEVAPHSTTTLTKGTTALASSTPEIILPATTSTTTLTMKITDSLLTLLRNIFDHVFFLSWLSR
jgi:hypothetical protein